MKLVLTSDNDPQLHDLTRCMSEEITGPTGWDRLGVLMVRLGHSNEAEELFETLLRKTTDEREKANIYNSLGVCPEQQGKYTDAVRIYEEHLRSIKKRLLQAIPV